MSDDPNHPYSEAVEVGGLVLLSGCLPVTPDGRLVTGKREALDAAVDTVRRRLGTLGLGLENVVKLTYYVTDIALREHANHQYVDTWSPTRPARTVVAVAGVPYSADVEIDSVAHSA